MNFEMIDLLDKAIDTDTEQDMAMLHSEGVLSSGGEIVENKLNLMTGAYAADLMNAIKEVDMNPQEVIGYFEILCQNNQYMGVFYFLLYLFAAVEMQLPYLFMILSRREDALRFYIGELIVDLKDCSTDVDE